jgi:hypothetical protein
MAVFVVFVIWVVAVAAVVVAAVIVKPDRMTRSMYSEMQKLKSLIR